MIRSFLLKCTLNFLICSCLFPESRLPVSTFFEANCIKCHGLEKSKGDITLHDIGDDFVDSDALEKWELILDVLKSGEMPPEDEKQRPSAKETRRNYRVDRKSLKRCDHFSYQKREATPCS